MGSIDSDVSILGWDNVVIVIKHFVANIFCFYFVYNDYNGKSNNVSNGMYYGNICFVLYTQDDQYDGRDGTKRYR